MLCLVYILGTFVLWILGIYRICEWMELNWKKRGGNTPEAMPGQEHGGTWHRAWVLARLRNHGVHGQAQFNGVPFLKSRTGIDVQHLAWLTKARDAKSKSVQELIEADRQLPETHIDLGHLLERVKRRAEKQKDPDTSPILAGSVGRNREASENGSHSAGAPTGSLASSGFCCCCCDAEGSSLVRAEDSRQACSQDGGGEEENAHAPIC